MEKEVDCIPQKQNRFHIINISSREVEALGQSQSWPNLMKFFFLMAIFSADAPARIQKFDLREIFLVLKIFFKRRNKSLK